MKKNFISLLFVSAITVGLLSACSSAPADDNATNPKAEAVTSQANHDTNSSPVSVTLNEVAILFSMPRNTLRLKMGILRMKELI